MSQTTLTRVYNFSAGPATLPLSVLEEIQGQMLSYHDTGLSVFEMSHRSKTYIDMHREVGTRLRQVLSIPDDYEVLFVQGGGRLQNLMIPMNFANGKDQPADYIVTGAWGKYSSGDAKAISNVNQAWDGAESNYSRTPAANELKLNPNANYVHFTSNETIHGVQFSAPPQTGNVPLINDASSDFMSRPIRVADYGMIYACAQKNAGVAGCTIVIIRKDLVEKTKGRAPGYLSYAAHSAAEDQMFNTPPTFSIYVTGLICRWIQEEIGGLERMEQHNRQKASILYQALDQHSGFYTGHAKVSDRSLMNVPFKTPTPELDQKFVNEAKQHLLSDLKGHRSLGGMRASIYNAMPIEGCHALAQFMADFAQKNG